jgi:GNAT superfamily N-acetyltransferase
MPVNHAHSRTEIKRCFPIMVQLRPNLTEPEFIERVTRQSDQYGYRLVYLEEAGQIMAVAGFIIREMLPLGRFLYVDDIVTDAAERSKGYGRVLFDWLADYARSNDCAHLHLDSRLDRKEAHRFYLRQGMTISGHHFALKLDESPGRVAE